MADSEQKDGKRVERNVVEIDIGSGRKLEFKTTVETGPPEAFGLPRTLHQTRASRFDTAKNLAASITYFLVVILCFKRISEAGDDTGFRIVMVLTIPFFLWLGFATVVGSRAIFTLDGSEEQIVKVIRLIGLVALLPMILVTRSLL